MGPHTTSDDPSRYEDRVAREDWAAKDPIDRLGKLLKSMGLFTDEFSAGVEAKAGEAAAQLRAGCLSLADPDPLSVFDNVLSTPSSWLERQKSQYAAYLATFEAGN